MKVRIAYASRCLCCDWTDDSDKADLAARKHLDATGHGVITRGSAE